MIYHVKSCDSSCVVVVYHVRSWIHRYQLQVFLHFEAMRVCCDVSFDTTVVADKVCVCKCVCLCAISKVICSIGCRLLSQVFITSREITNSMVTCTTILPCTYFFPLPGQYVINLKG